MMTNKKPATESIEKATGKNWEEWMEFMDKINAKELSHPEIANKVRDYLKNDIDNPGWWAQSVTVAYEQAIGRRLPGQRSDGKFETSVSRTTKLGMEELMKAWEDFANQDGELQKIVASPPRTSGTDKRMYWRAKAKDGSNITIVSEPRGTAAAIIAQQSGLIAAELKESAQDFWKDLLTRFLKTL